MSAKKPLAQGKPLAPGKTLVRPWQQWNTLQKLQGSLYLIWVLDALLLFTAIVGAQVHRDAMKAVGKDTALSIIHAQGIKTSLADMDADVANELLGEPGQMEKDAKGYEDKRKEASTDLIEAAKNITFEGEQEPIERIQVALGSFEALVQRARDLHDRGDAAYVEAYRDAANVMDKTLLPETDKLDKINDDELTTAYRRVSNRSVGMAFLLLVSGGALLWAMVVIQKFLNNRTHRTLNALLLLSTLLALGFVLYSVNTLAFERHQLKIAKEDAFVSIHALLRAKALAYAANADESRYVLDSKHAADHERHFNEKATLLASPPSGGTLDHVLEEVRKRRKAEGFTGLLADELNNITFEGEREKAVSTLEHFISYLRIDDRLRELQQSGRHADAVELCIGTKASESNTVFGNFDDALDETVEINQKHFDAAIGEGFSALANFELKAVIIALAIALLAFVGLRKRIQEYA